MDRVPPPAVHMHLRLLDVASSVPIGDLSQTDSTALPSSLPPPESTVGKVASALPHGTRPAHPSSIEATIPDHERDAFDAWLRALWREKDAKLDNFHATGAFKSRAGTVDIPLKVKALSDIGNAFCWFAPVIALTAMRKITGKS